MADGRIMVVDDDVALLGFTGKYLSRLGYSVHTCRNSEEAWKQFNANGANYSLAVIDVSLPGLSGVELSRMILNATADVRLILTSGYPFDPHKLLAPGPGRIAFLHKPFSPSMLAQAVSGLIGAAAAGHAD